MKNPALMYLQSLQSEKSRTGMRSLLNNIVVKLSPEDTLETFDWVSLSHADIYELRARLSEEKKTPNTINTYLAAIKGVAREAWRLDQMPVETLHKILDVERARGKRADVGRALMIEEMNEMLDHCLVNDASPIGMRDACVIALVYGAGLRRQEAADLKLSDYCYERSELNVLGKGNKERVNALNDRVIDIVEQWLDERGRFDGPLFVRIRKGDNISQDPISDKSIYNIIVRRYKECGLARLSPHDLRRTYATVLLEAGEDISTVQDLMGHASMDTTKRYIKRNEKQKVKAARSLPL